MTGHLYMDAGSPLTNQIKNLADPTVSSDAATKNYVDEEIVAIPTGISTGSVVAIAANSVPFGWLACEGAAVSRTTYASLFALIGTTYGVGDGSTTFNVPDYRDEFLRGKSAIRTVGDFENHALQDHRHYVGSGGAGWTGSAPGGVWYAASLISWGYPHPPPLVYTAYNANVAAETRPRNRSVLYIIKY
jgi:hypothetical protein